MPINYNATDRKPLVKAVSEFLGTKAVYMKTPTSPVASAMSPSPEKAICVSMIR